MSFGIAATILIVCSSILGGLVGIQLLETAYQQEAIQHACAQYDPKTGEFTWITPTDQ